MDSSSLSQSILNLHLSIEQCQSIQLQACKALVKGIVSQSPIPDSFRQEDFLQRVHYFGYDSLLMHPSDIQNIFAGVTTEIYKTITALYCDPIGRSIATIHFILSAMCKKSDKAPVSYEAVWLICLYLERLYERKAVVEQVTTDQTWYIQACPIGPSSKSDEGDKPKTRLILVIREADTTVLSFIVNSWGTTKQCVLSALYKALVNQRKPAARETAGILIHVPAKICIEPELLSIEQCGFYSAPFQFQNTSSPTNIVSLLADISLVWSQSVQINDTNHFTRLFDTYLFKAFGLSPERTRLAQVRRWGHLKGFDTDPAVLWPLLRNLLPKQPANIQQDVIAWNGLHYEHPLLSYWPEKPVFIRISPEVESRCWVYFDDEVVCEARARELKRKDGSYRDNRDW